MNQHIFFNLPIIPNFILFLKILSIYILSLFLTMIPYNNLTKYYKIQTISADKQTMIWLWKKKM